MKAGVIVSFDDFITSCYCFVTGNENLHYLTKDTRQMLRVDLEDWEGNKTYALYDKFRVEKEDFGFKLRSVGKYSGTAGRYDNLQWHHAVFPAIARLSCFHCDITLSVLSILDGCIIVICVYK